MYFITSDEHYFHANIIKFCNRPFKNMLQMHTELIKRHNKIVGPKDIVIHAGDFSFAGATATNEIIKGLNGTHIFLHGSHDYWTSENLPYIWEKKINDKYIVVCHYAMLT